MLPALPKALYSIPILHLIYFQWAGYPLFVLDMYIPSLSVIYFVVGHYLFVLATNFIIVFSFSSSFDLLRDSDDIFGQALQIFSRLAK